MRQTRVSVRSLRACLVFVCRTSSSARVLRRNSHHLFSRTLGGDAVLSGFAFPFARVVSLWHARATGSLSRQPRLRQPQQRHRTEVWSMARRERNQRCMIHVRHCACNSVVVCLRGSSAQRRERESAFLQRIKAAWCLSSKDVPSRLGQQQGKRQGLCCVDVALNTAPAWYLVELITLKVLARAPAASGRCRPACCGQRLAVNAATLALTPPVAAGAACLPWRCLAPVPVTPEMPSFQHHC